MTELLWPGAQRAAGVFTDEALVEALVVVELEWYLVLADAGVAPRVDLPSRPRLVAESCTALSGQEEAVEAGGNPVIPLLAVLRAQLAPTAPEAARWLHRGLTSQDALDTALMLLLQKACRQVLGSAAGQVRTLRTLAERHRRTVTAGRTLTQHAVPTTFGLTAANWLNGVLDALEDLRRVTSTLPVQVGGASGTLAAVAFLTSARDDPGVRALELGADLAGRLGLQPAPPWHTNRRPVTRTGDVLVAVVDAWSHIANDVLVRARPEVGELSEGTQAGRGGSSTMPHKQNPILSVLVRRAGLTAPQLGATLHAAAAAAVDERPDGGWHAEWTALRTLARQAVVAGAQTVDLLGGLEVHEDRMRETATRATDDLLAERLVLAELRGLDPRSSADLDAYLGASDRLVDAAVGRADAYLREPA